MNVVYGLARWTLAYGGWTKQKVLIVSGLSDLSMLITFADLALLLERNLSRMWTLLSIPLLTELVQHASRMT